MKHLYVAFAGCSATAQAGFVVKERIGGEVLSTHVKPIEPGDYADWQALVAAISLAIDLGADHLTLVGNGPALQQVQQTRHRWTADLPPWYLFFRASWYLIVLHFNGRMEFKAIPPSANPAIKVAEGACHRAYHQGTAE